MNNVFLGKPPASIERWIKDHAGHVVKETTVVKYTAASGLSDWEGDIVGVLTNESIPNISNAEVVEIGSHVTTIGFNAFDNCGGLTNVTIPNSVINIRIDAFKNCNHLSSVTIGDNVTSIGGGAFNGCNSLTSMTIPNSVTFLGSEAFLNCSGLTSLTFIGRTLEQVQAMGNYSWGVSNTPIINVI